MYVKCVVEQCMEEAEAEASPPEAVEAELPSDFTWAMSLGVDQGCLPLRVFNPIVHLHQLRFAQSASNPVVPPASQNQSKTNPPLPQTNPVVANNNRNQSSSA
jgi:hypothetical protein